MELPIFEEETTSIIQDSNFNALSKKSSFRKMAKTSMRDDNFNSIIDEVNGLPKPNEVVFIKTNGCSDTGSIFSNILLSEKIETLYLSTWVISRNNIERIIKAIDKGDLKQIYFVVSKRLKELKKSDYAFLIEQFSKRSDKCFYKVCNSHAKTFSVKTDKGNLYTVTGSGNWTENPRIENFVIFNDENAFNHNKEWMEEMINGKEK
jgi:hypothetical protein